MKRPPEAWVQAQIRKALDAKGIPNQKVPGSMLLRGMPDLFCGAFWIEVKAPGRKLRPSQVEWCERFDAFARIYVIDDPALLWVTLEGENNWSRFKPKRDHRDKLREAVAEWSR